MSKDLNTLMEFFNIIYREIIGGAVKEKSIEVIRERGLIKVKRRYEQVSCRFAMLAE